MYVLNVKKFKFEFCRHNILMMLPSAVMELLNIKFEMHKIVSVKETAIVLSVVVQLPVKMWGFALCVCFSSLFMNVVMTLVPDNGIK